jgi:hypothetical protein
MVQGRRAAPLLRDALRNHEHDRVAVHGHPRLPAPRLQLAQQLIDVYGANVDELRRLGRNPLPRVGPVRDRVDHHVRDRPRHRVRPDLCGERPQQLLERLGRPRRLHHMPRQGGRGVGARRGRVVLDVRRHRGQPHQRQPRAMRAMLAGRPGLPVADNGPGRGRRVGRGGRGKALVKDPLGLRGTHRVCDMALLTIMRRAEHRANAA